MNKRSQFQVLHALLCDDVRREFNGKMILIGVYSGDVVVASLPATLVFTLWISALVPRTTTIEFRVLGHQNQQILPDHTQQITAPPNPERPVDLTVGGILLNLQAEGKITFQWRVKGANRWEPLLTTMVSKGTIPTPAFAAPSR
jgi:uncharacterized protein DUF6941